MRQQSTVQLSQHAKLRWTMRSGEMRMTLATAWEAAVEIHEHGDLTVDEVRYHEETETLLLRRGSWVTTVLEAQYADQAVQAAVEAAREVGNA